MIRWSRWAAIAAAGVALAGRPAPAQGIDILPLVPPPQAAAGPEPVASPKPLLIPLATRPLTPDPAPALATPTIVTPAPTPAPTPTPAVSPPARAAAESPTAAPASLTGRQEPAVSLEWAGPAAVRVGQPVDYTIVARNTCASAVQQVMVRVRLPQGVSATASDPPAGGDAGVLVWELGTMMPRQEKALAVRLSAAARGDSACFAYVTFTGASAVNIRAREPKLLAKAGGPERATAGDSLPFTVTLSNPGDHPTERVRLHVALSDGLESPRGNKFDVDLGPLAPGETRSAQVLTSAKAGGEQWCEITAEADAGLKVSDRATTVVQSPKINLAVNGPKMKYLERRAAYVFTVSNPGDAPAHDVSVSDVVPAGLKFLSADGGQYDFAARTVQWVVGELPPGQSRELKLELLASEAGEHRHKVAARASRGLSAENAELVTRVEGLAALLVEAVDTEDPVEVSGETSYDVRVTNTGSKTEADVKLVCTLPADRMQFKNAHGPAPFKVEGNDVVFESLPQLQPKAEAVFRVTVQVLSKGVAIFQTRITSANVPGGVIRQESTTVYGD